MKNIVLKYKNKKINLEVKNCKYFFQRIRGLMFCRREKAFALLFDFKKLTRISIHSLFVFFPFIAVWIDDKNRVIEVRKVELWEFRVLPKKKFCKLVEIPFNKKYEEILLSTRIQKDLNSKSISIN